MPIDIPQRNKFVANTPLLRELHGMTELRQAKALDEHCQKCAEEINRGGFDILFANSSIIQAVSSIGRYVKTKKVLYLQEPNRRLYEAGRDGLPWIAIPALSRPWMHPRSHLRWFLSDLDTYPPIPHLSSGRAAQCQRLRSDSRKFLLQPREPFARVRVRFYGLLSGCGYSVICKPPIS